MIYMYYAGLDVNSIAGKENFIILDKRLFNGDKSYEDFILVANSLSGQGFTVLLEYSSKTKVMLREFGILYEYIVPKNSLTYNGIDGNIRDKWFYEIVDAFKETESTYFHNAMNIYHTWEKDMRDIIPDNALKIYTNSIHTGSWVHKVKEENNHIYPCTNNVCMLDALCED